MFNERYLVSCIFEQAVSDYKELKTKGVSEVNGSDSGSYSILDLELFFRGKWCNKLLELMGINVRGEDIIVIINESLGVV